MDQSPIKFIRRNAFATRLPFPVFVAFTALKTMRSCHAEQWLRDCVARAFVEPADLGGYSIGAVISISAGR